ncbi:MAG TPA: lipoprotein-releasing ABC transporter permease subunit [Legionellales bacterium]|jgi:lipoprotein-releasing system permease protein|nr:lipoprotein-releasing ABC transporter permease subunit [Legionellales bacterium]
MNPEKTIKKPLAFSLGWRYTRAKSKSHFVSFISLTSMLGIALGVTVLITVLSVMNGFDVEIHKRFFDMAPSITINGRDGRISNWQALSQKLAKTPEVEVVAPFIGTQGLVSFMGQVQPIVITGVDFKIEEQFSEFSKKLLPGSHAHPKPFGIYVGQNLAEGMGLMVGDQMTVMLPQATPTPLGMIPRFKRFTVEGVFSAGHGFNFDTKLAFIDLKDAQALLQMDEDVTGLKLKINNVYHAPELAQNIANQLGAGFIVGDWTLTYGPFFQAVKMEKTMMFFILLLIIAVAAFNLVSSLVMVVTDKQAEIAILRTLGGTPRLIMSIFMIQGMLLGIGGTLIGVIGGLLLASNATDIVDFLQNHLGVQWLSSNIYFVDHLPVHIDIWDIIKVVCTALGLSWLATLYPSWRAGKIIITEALHHE